MPELLFLALLYSNLFLVHIFHISLFIHDKDLNLDTFFLGTELINTILKWHFQAHSK